MRKFKSEFLSNYNTYTFGYSEYAVMESNSDISAIYDNGFLPYTGDTNIKYPIFYLARSLRINLQYFSDSSENRRIQRKLSKYNPRIIRHTLNNFDISNTEFNIFCLKYIKERFPKHAMDKKRLKYILNAGIGTDVFEIRTSIEDILLGYVLAVVNSDTFHYWFSFFNTDFLGKIPLGKWLMWRMIKWSNDENLKYIYLGTGYGEKSLYKIRDFKGIEYFDGNKWNNDVKTLKNLCKSDDKNKTLDYFKTIKGKNKYLDSIIK